MDDAWILIVILLIVGSILAAIVLPIVALVIAIQSKRRVNAQLARLTATAPLTPETLLQLRTNDLAPLARAVQQLEARVEGIEAHLRGRPVPAGEVPPAPQPPPRPAPPTQTGAPPPPPTVPQAPVFTPFPPAPARDAAELESIIGRRWLGWVAVTLILLATAFFFKYAFDNRWIGELGRVTIGVTAGAALTVLGFRYYQRGWRIFSQILTAGGVVLLYLSVYAAFGYYHLVEQRAAFAYLIILIAEAGALALLYNAPSIAIMALIGGFLTPILLRSDRDQYRSLFAYIALLDIGALAMLKHWIGPSSIAFAGTHLLFWLWYVEKYHPHKLGAVMVFQTGIFLLFLLAPLARRIFRKQSFTFEDLALLPINAFVFYATAFDLLDPKHHDWMGTLAIGMALVYAGSAKILLQRSATTRLELFAMIGVALTFVTLAIPIQLEANWITIAWGIEALIVLWVGMKTRSGWLHGSAAALFTLAIGRIVLLDTPYLQRQAFTPVLNKYFLSSLAVTACIFGAAALYRVWNARDESLKRNLHVLSLLVGIGLLWFLMSIEIYTYFRAWASALKHPEEARQVLWLGQMALSVLWSAYAGALVAVGFVRRSAAVRWAGLALFGVTVTKVMLVDIAQLKQLYRIIAFLVLGVLLLMVAWGYHKAFRNKESTK